MYDRIAHPLRTERHSHCELRWYLLGMAWPGVTVKAAYPISYHAFLECVACQEVLRWPNEANGQCRMITWPPLPPDLASILMDMLLRLRVPLSRTERHSHW